MTGPSRAGPDASGLRSDIAIVSQRKTVDFEDVWYDLSGPDHFWMQWRLTAFQHLLRRLSIDLEAPLRVLEVGGGQGTLRGQVEGISNWSIDLSDLNLAALNRATAGRGDILFYDVTELNADLVSRYDVVLLFDVLEHIDETAPFLDAVIAHLKPGGLLAINVPALQSLYSTYDVIVGHHRRYDRRTLADELAGKSVMIREMQYWGASTIPVLAARKLWLGLGRRPDTEDQVAAMVRQGFEPSGALVDRILRALMQCETALIPHPPIGTSLLCVATRSA